MPRRTAPPASRSYSSTNLYALIKRKPGADGEQYILIKVTRLSGFRSSGFFFVDGTTLDGKKIELHGHGRHTPDDPCAFEIFKIS